MVDDATDRTASLFPAVPRAWNFPEASTAELARRLAAAGEGATLTVLPYRRGELLLLHLRVVPVADALMTMEDGGDINESRPCPPFTGCGGGA